MSPEDPLVRAAARYYEEKLAAHGPGPQGMDWKDAASQRLRFEVLMRHLPWSPPPTLLDVGCGSGALATWLAEAGRPPASYLGIDAAGPMVEAACAALGPGAARRATIDELAAEGASFDLVVASGTFNVKQDAPVEAWRAYVHDQVAAMYRVCRRALAVNFMTSYVDWRYDRLWYPTAQELADLAVTRLSRRFVLDHAYPLREVTLVVLREPA